MVSLRAVGHSYSYVAHFNKSGNSGKALHKFMGSIAFVAGPRAAFAVIEDPDDPTRRLFLHAKNNLARPPQGLSFHVEQMVLPDCNITTSRVSWDFGTVDVTADEAVAASQAKSDAPTLEEAKQFLEDLIGPGGLDHKVVAQQAKDAGLSWSTIRRAKEKLGIRSERSGFGPDGVWLWKK
jgi:hypothetical protein